MVLLSVMGAFSHGPEKSLGGFSLVAAYEPILIAFTCSTFALQGLPAVLAGYRERGILRRLNATPVGAGRLLGAQLTVNLSVTLIATLGILVVGAAAFGVPLPGQPAGFVLALLLTAAAMLSLGLLIAALARNGRVAGAVGTMLFLPLMFFAGLWTPRATMSRRAAPRRRLHAARRRRLRPAAQHGRPVAVRQRASRPGRLHGGLRVARLAPVPLGMTARLSRGRFLPRKAAIVPAGQRVDREYALGG